MQPQNMATVGYCLPIVLVIITMKTLLINAKMPLTPQVNAILSAELVSSRDEFGALILFSYTKQKISLVGANFTNKTQISFTTARVLDSARKSGDCEDLKKTKSFSMYMLKDSNSIGDFEIELDDLDPGEKYYYVCIREYFRTKQDNHNHNDKSRWTHQGVDSWKSVGVKPISVEKKSYLLPLAVQVGVLVTLLCLSGLFSGLNLGLMALDQTELQIIEKCGSSKEKKYAKVIGPLRKRGNFLLCTLLLGNVLVNNTLTILLDDLSNGMVAVVCSTTAIVIFGEIVPQAICSRHGLAVGARTIWLTKLFMLITFPVSFPISMLLDKILGEEIGQVYNKEKLQELIRMTADVNIIQNEEANIITGALQLANKVCSDIMTKIEDVYMLDIHTNLDFEMMSEIINHGYTRIPVFDGDKSRIVNLLNIKDLTLIDPDDKTPLMTVCKFYDHRPLFVDDDTKLDSMLQEFLQGKSHMAVVQHLVNNGNCDPYYEIIGVVTLEDVIEEIIQTEIVDETDVLTDNRLKQPRRREKQDYSLFNPEEDSGSKMSPQLAMAALQFLSTAVEPFGEEVISRSVLKRLMHQNIVVTLNPTPLTSDTHYIYREGVDADYFVLILQGSAEVLVGKEKMLFIGGPFSYFGLHVLKNLSEGALSPLQHGASDSIYTKMEPYKPDFTLRATAFVQYLRIRRAHYIVARRTTLMVHGRQEVEREDSSVWEQFHREWHRATNIITSNDSANGVTGPDGQQVTGLGQDFGVTGPDGQRVTSLGQDISVSGPDGQRVTGLGQDIGGSGPDGQQVTAVGQDIRTKDGGAHCSSGTNDIKKRSASPIKTDSDRNRDSAERRVRDLSLVSRSTDDDNANSTGWVDPAGVEPDVPSVVVVSPNSSEGDNIDEQTPLVHGAGSSGSVS